MMRLAAVFSNTYLHSFIRNKKQSPTARQSADNTLEIEQSAIVWANGLRDRPLGYVKSVSQPQA
jgi:hypothetical protein